MISSQNPKSQTTLKFLQLNFTKKPKSNRKCPTINQGTMSMLRCNNQSATYMHDMATPMHTTFFWGDDVVLLFAGWPGSGHLGMYLLALAVVFLLAAVAELLSSARAPDRRWQAQPSVALGDAAGNAASHAVHMVLAYFVMLSVMSYNIGVFLAAVAGGAIGRFVVVYRELIAAARPPEEVEY